MSEVLLGYDVGDPRFVALKFLRGPYRQDESAIGRLKREADIYRTLDHPGVVRLVDDGPVEGGGYFLAQEFLRGQSLTETMDEVGGPLRLPQSMAILEDVGDALRAAHSHGIIHRDIQPQNVMFGPDGRATVFDFGIAYAADDLVHTEAGTVMGTIVYSAPEQRRGERVDHRADVFGLGAILYECLTGRKAIQARTFEEALDASTSDIPVPSRRNPDVPPELDAMCMRLLADEPDHRYQDLKDLLVEIGKLRVEADEGVKARLFGSREMRRIDEGITAMRSGDMKLAQAIAGEFAEGLAPEGEEAEANYLVGLIHSADGRTDQAARSFDKALFFDEELLDARLDYSMMLLREGEYERAGQMLDQVPGAHRGNLLVLGLMDTVEQLKNAPPGVLEAARKDREQKEKKRGNLLGSIRSLFGR
jgi:tetratricopeptide (TPR) repeat protein